jgi:O-antigen ligase
LVRFSVDPALQDAPVIRPDTSTPRPVRRATQGSRRYGRLNTLTGRLLVLMVIMSAVPVASNRPAWWLVWTLLLGLGGMAYMLRTHWLARGRRLQITRFRLFLALALLVPAYAVLQSLPLATHLPLALQTLPPRLPDMLRPESLSVMPGASFLGAIRAVGFVVFLILVIEIGTEAERTHALGLMLLGGIVLHGMFGLVALRLLDDFAIWGDKEVYRGVLTGTFVNRNSVATFLGFGVVLAVAFAMVRAHRASLLAPDRGLAALLTPQRLEVIGLWLAAALLGLAILLTQSRMATAATAAGTLVTFITLRLAFRQRPGRIALEAVAGLVVLVAFLIPAVGEGLVERALFTLVESTDRVSIYVQTWGMIQERPLIGFGHDAFATAYEMYRDEPLVSERFVDMAHNTYLALWAEQGLVVGSIPILLTGWAGLMIVQRLRRDEGDMAVNAAALGAITLGGLHSLADFSLEIPANVYCFLLIVGLAIARPRLPVASEDAAPAPDDTPAAARGTA